LLEAALAMRIKLGEHSATARTERALSRARALARVNSARFAVAARIPREDVDLGGALRAAAGAAAGALAAWRLLGRRWQRWRLALAIAAAAAAVYFRRHEHRDEDTEPAPAAAEEREQAKT
jgi:hypothetical protein